MHSLTNYCICSPTRLAVDRSRVGKANCCYILLIKRQGELLFSGSSWSNLNIYTRKGWLLPGVALGIQGSPIMHFQGGSHRRKRALETPARSWAASRVSGRSLMASQTPGRAWLPPPKWAVKAPPGPLRSGLGEKGTKARGQRARWEERSGCGAQPPRPRSPAGRRRGRCREARAARPASPGGRGGTPGRPWYPTGARLAADRWVSLWLPRRETPPARP